MWVKICANTSFDDALLAAKSGASAIGFVFAPSPRQVTPSQARTFSQGLPEEIERIGVFQTQNAQEVILAVETASLTGVQLHGNLDLQLIQTLQRRFADRISLIQTLHWSDRSGALSPFESLREQLGLVRRERSISRVLIDSQVGSVRGGSGVPFDWSSAAALREELGDVKLIIAGGLRPENVQDAIRILSPWGVDVASGVELSPGRKDPEKVTAFIKKASLRPYHERR